MKKYERSLQIGLVRNSDIGKEMTLRNANEHRRLAGHLKDLDSQLHHKLVSIQAEMMELRTSAYGDRRNKSARLNYGSRERANSDFGLRALTPVPRTLTSARSLNNLHEKHSKSLVLPEINVQQTSLVGTSSSSGKSSPREQLARKEFQKQFLQPPTGLPSVYRPSSLPDLRSAEERCRFSPKTARKTLQNMVPLEPSPLTKEKLLSIQTFDGKMEDNKEDNSDEQQLIVPAINYQGFDDNNDGTKNSEDSNSIFLNSLLTKAAYNSDDDAQVEPDLTSFGFMDFNDVIDKRLQLSQEELPSEEEMRKVRYLRWGKEDKEVDLVDAVFEKRDKNRNDQNQ